MQGKLQNTWRSTAIFILALLMIASLFSSRAMLSATIICFCAVSFLHSEPAKQWRRFFSSPLLWGMSLLFLVPLISGLWSNDQREWQLMILIKLPLFLLPLAFAAPDLLTKKQCDWIAYFFIATILLATCWSFILYLQDTTAITRSYLQAKSMPTVLENDHVRFSWLVSIAIFLGIYILFTRKEIHRTVYFLLILIVFWFTIYLHLLAARTGLLSFYIILFGLIVWLAFRKMKWRIALIALSISIALPVIAFFTLPTFENKVRYFMYDLSYFKNTTYLPGANDAVRMISINAGWNLMNHDPVAGVGFGDIIEESRNWYAENYPSMIEADKIYPSSQWIMYGAGAGWPGFLLFALSMLLPYFIRMRERIFWWTLNLSATVSLLFDPGLEVQFGVFAYAFVVLFVWKWFEEQYDFAGKTGRRKEKFIK